MKQGKALDDKYYCSSPFNSIFLDTHGSISSCCAGTERWGNLKTDNIESIINSSLATKLRDDVKNGKKNSYCNQCYNNEKESTSSQREHFNGIDIDTTKDFDVKTLDIRWSTVCNFSCIYCTEDFSSTWAKKKGLATVRGNLQKENELLEYIRLNSTKIEKIMMAGGEPLLQTQNIKLLDLVSADTHITIITNMGVDLSKSIIFKKLSKLKNIRWSLSLENVENEFEYIRHGGKWQLLLDNINYIKNNTNHYIHLLSVYNVFTIPSIQKFIEFAERTKVDIMFQPILDKDALNPYDVSNDIIQYFINTLKSIKGSNQIEYGEDFLNKSLIQFQNILENKTRTKFSNSNLIKFIENFESKYNETTHKFSTLWPELNEFLNPNKLTE